MFKSLAPAARTASLAAVALALGAVSTFAAGRTAVVDMAMVYKQYPEVTKTTFFLKQKKDEYQAQIDKERRKIEELSEQSKNQRGVSEAKLRELENQKRRMLFELQTKFQSFKEKLQDLEKNEFEKIRDAVKSALSRIARRKSYALVIEKQWLYYGEAEDLTASLITSLGGEVPPELKTGR